MSGKAVRGEVAAAARALALEGFAPRGGRRFESHPAWAALRHLGSRLWLDTGDLEAARELWSAEFTNLTTNNTLVNQEVQKGLFDAAIPAAARGLREADPSLGEEDLVVEVGFVLNCRVALRLVAAFDATVSVELHPGMADDAERSVEYGRRYYAVCPERFIIKVPLTPAGFLAARRLSGEGIPVNFTLGFSARQNVLAAAFSRPAFVNVFMGRLNSFVKDNGLGDGAFVGEKATMSTQVALLQGRASRGWSTLLIGASMRSASQVWDLAGLDVFTMPVAAAREYREQFEAGDRTPARQIGREFTVSAYHAEVLECLWRVEDRFYAGAESLARAESAAWTGADFAGAARDAGLRGLFRAWTPAERLEIRAKGKIPAFARWRDDLLTGRAALDELMSVSALYSFVTDQDALDNRIRSLLPEGVS